MQSCLILDFDILDDLIQRRLMVADAIKLMEQPANIIRLRLPALLLRASPFDTLRHIMRTWFAAVATQHTLSKSHFPRWKKLLENSQDSSARCSPP